jgi:hypothetical protein
MSSNGQNRKFAFYMNGLPGAGKTTTNTIIQDIVASKGGVVLNVSFDKWIRKGFQFADIPREIEAEIRAFESKIVPLKVAVIDFCNERGAQDTIFNFNFRTAGYQISTFRPNYYNTNFDDYRAWCLNNVIARPEPQANDKFALTPSTAGLQRCYEVHDAKAVHLARLWRSRAAPSATIHSNMRERATRYAALLRTHNLEQEVRTFMGPVFS